MSSLGYSRTKTAQRGWGNPALSMNATGQQGRQAGPDLREGSWGETLGLKKNWGGCCLELGSGGGWKPWRFMSVLLEFNLIRNRERSAAPHQLPQSIPDIPNVSVSPDFLGPSPPNSVTANTPLLDSVYPLLHSQVWVLLWGCHMVLSTTVVRQPGLSLKQSSGRPAALEPSARALSSAEFTQFESN